MKVSELIAKLQQFDPELEVISDVYSDYSQLEEVYQLTAVDKGNYIMRPHPTMSEQHKQQQKQYVYVGIWKDVS